MKQYLDLLDELLLTGAKKTDRTGTGTLSTFAHQMRFDLSEGFPMLTTKRLPFKAIVGELLFFLSGETNQKVLLDEDITIWKEWGDANGNLGPIYSHQWRNAGGKHKNRPQPKQKHTPVGDYDRNDSLQEQLFTVWRGMLARCYNPNKDTYTYYGGRGVYVCDRWLVFSNFYADVLQLPGWEDKLANWSVYQLDKDIIGDGFRYGPDSCIWVSRTDNARRKKRITYTLAHDDGCIETVEYPSEFRLAHNIAQGNFSAMLRGERPSAGGWRLIDSHDHDLGFDQISWTVEELKRNPDSRRLVVSSWNAPDLQHMALPPCHCLFQFYVADNKLSCQLYQRSADVFLGVPFNIASYALLTHMMAQQTGLQVGEFVWTGGDVHLYSNHVEQAREQLQREPTMLPVLLFSRKPNSIFDFEAEDIQLLDYNPAPSIKAPVAV